MPEEEAREVEVVEGCGAEELAMLCRRGGGKHAREPG